MNRVFAPWLPVFCVAVGVLTSVERASAQTWQEQIGYDKLVNELGSVEDGTGITVSMGEADTNSSPSIFTYLPDSANAGLAGKTIIDGSGLSTGTPSGHATTQARSILGDISIAQGASEVTVYEASDYLNRILGFSGGGDPLAQPFKVQSHAWIGNGLSVSDAENLLQRLDYMIPQNGVSVQVGLNNNSGNPQPQLLGQAYNVISVGRTDGNHSRGLTTLYGAGRLMPDVVIPGPNTSRSTSRTSSVMTVLHQKAVNDGNTDASRPVSMKAILMAGATKDEFPGWARTTTQPLDPVFGAGEVNIYNSYKILASGETDGSLSVPVGPTITARGWDYGESIDSGAPLYYNFEVGSGQEFRDVSILLTWDMDITDGDPGILFSPVTSLADMSLSLYDSTGSPLASLLDQSLSTVDNVEHIFLTSLTEGLYSIEISTDSTTDFALAWNATVIPEPQHAVIIGIFMMIGLMVYRRDRQRRRVFAHGRIR